MTIHIACSTFNGAPYVGPFFESLLAQTHADWRLWTRDNGSQDETLGIVDGYARRDARIGVVDRGSEALGVLGTFSRLLDLVPPDAEYVILADQDDVWLPNKLAITLEAMRRAEAERPAPTLVHTDLRVVDATLRPIADSFWEFSGLDSSLTSLRHLTVRNNVTAGTAMMNRALRERVAPIPAAAAMHDWWMAMTAAAFGRIVAVPDRTVLYRQHGNNVIGASRRLSARSPIGWLFAAPEFVSRTGGLRAGLARAAAQATEFLRRHGAALPDTDREFLAAYGAIPGRGAIGRRISLWKLQRLPGYTFAQQLGLLLRA